MAVIRVDDRKQVALRSCFFLYLSPEPEYLSRTHTLGRNRLPDRQSSWTPLIHHPVHTEHESPHGHEPGCCKQRSYDANFTTHLPSSHLRDPDAQPPLG